jgi:hypothetical protein
MYVQRNIESRSRNRCCSGRAISIAYCERVLFVAFDIQRAMHKRHIIISCLSGSTNIFPHYLINGTIFEIKLLIIKCVLNLSTTFVRNISHFKK